MLAERQHDGIPLIVNEAVLRILAVEAANGLSGADLAARKSHSFKRPLIAELGLQVWLPGCGRIWFGLAPDDSPLFARYQYLRNLRA